MQYKDACWSSHEAIKACVPIASTKHELHESEGYFLCGELRKWPYQQPNQQNALS
jgi:hypothetical protein